ncbi:MAG: hypothetical protein DI587_38025 [Variovorax paradoxus]|nr:MAG: hypothetical protein DI583_38025 [Variovorax paradoxus]PZP99821.1 MAG: hypothetical protein DI587_38025 [Variovorax paradoxus]
MPKFSTPAGTTQRYIPGVDRASPDSIPGTKKIYADRAAFLQGIADERACIAMGLPVWYDGIDVQVLSEPPAVKRLWTLATGAGSPANNAAASHGRTVVIAFKKFTLASDDNRVHASTGAPDSGLGDNGDLCLDDAAGVVYRKATGAWSAEASFGAGSGLPTQISASTVIPLTGNAIMAKQTISGPTTFTLGAMAPGGSCVVQTVSNGVNAPVWPGTEWETTYGYDNSQAGLLNTASYFTFDGLTAYYIQGKPTGQTPVPVAPGAPTSVVATAGNGSVSVAFAAPASNGGSAILDYTVTLSTGQTATGASSPISVTAPNGTAVTATVRARNAVGQGAASSASNSVTPSSGITAPGAPTGATATAGDGSVSVAFTAPASNGGATITGYRVTLSTGQTATGASSPISVSAPNGTPVTATVAAQNSVGYGAESSASNSVTPVAAGSTVMRLTALNNLTESGNGTAGWDYKATSGADYSGYGASSIAIPAGAEGYFEVRQPAGGVSIAILALKTTNAAQAHTAFAYACQPLLPGQGSQRYIQFSGGGAGAAPNGATVLTAANQWYRVGTRINGANLDGYIEVTSDNGATFQLVHTWPTIPKVPYYCGLATGSSANNATNLRSLGAS